MAPQGVVSFVAMVVALVVACLALVAVHGTASRIARAFAACSLAAALFGGANFAIVASESERCVVFFAGLAFLGAGVYGAAALELAAALGARAMPTADRVVSAISVALGAAGLVPGLVTEGPIRERTAWLGLTYRDATPTAVADVAGAFASLAMVLVFVRGLQLARQGHGAGRSLALGGLVIALAAASDSFAFINLTRVPYLCDVAFLITVCATAATLARTNVEHAAALELASQELRAAQDALVRQKQLAAIGEMSAIIAHEVRSPVAVIYNVLSLLRRHQGTKAPEVAELMTTLSEEAVRLKRLVDDLLEFARPLAVRVGDHELEPIVQGAIAAARAEGAGEVEFAPSADLPLFVGDSELLRRALVNLVRNAHETTPGARVQVSCAVADDRLRIAVIDSGAGVAEQHRKHIFTPFFTTRASGTGLGLALVKKVAEAHGGVASYEPTVGGGATFTLALPLRPAA